VAYDLLASLGVTLPVLAAPMAGGPGTPALASAAAAAGSLGFVAAGYKTPDAFADELAAVSFPCAVNLFAPNPVPVSRAEFRSYAALLAPEAARYGLSLSDEGPIEDDDHWAAKVEIVRAHPVPLITFTFGIPGPSDLSLLRATGARLAQTVTTVDEARAAAEAGVDCLVVQSVFAGGHSATLDPRRPLVETPLPSLIASISAAVRLPLIAAGGISSASDVAAAVRAGADAVAVGTLLLRCDEAGTSSTHRAALVGSRPTVLTHAFTGRPARGLRNEFIDRYETVAPYGYPALNHLTGPMRRAAAAAGDPERVHLWAGTGYHHATEEPAASILTRLAGLLP
jgi:NAD(P)H-dependent flavin oxidoreductase YrpB (nitropropane dioxygenase family)